MKQIPYGRQYINDDDVQAVIETLRSDFLTQGPKVTEFETVFAQYVGCKYAVAVSNGTAALHLSALALGVSPEKQVITTPITFAATGNSIEYCGGSVTFADIDPDTYLIDIDSIAELLKRSPKGTFSGIISVDFAGRAVNLEELKQLADQYGLWIIDDACHAPGGYFVDRAGNKQYCGNGVYANATVFSFHPVKHITSGEGGMITTNDKQLYERLLKLRTHGISRDENSFENDVCLASSSKKNKAYPGWYMEMQDLGYNYRITDIQAALGISQLKRANEGINRRRAIAKKYDAAFVNCPMIRSSEKPSPGHAYHLYIIEAVDRLELYNSLKQHKIFSQVHYFPLHLMPYYRRRGWKEGDLPNAEDYYTKCLSLPMFPTLTDAEQDYVIEKVLEFYSKR